MTNRPHYTQRAPGFDDRAQEGRPRPDVQRETDDNDPLAELARLIGQTDPFANFGRESAGQPQTPPAPHVEAFPLPPTRGPAAGLQSSWRKAAPPRDDVADDGSAHGWYRDEAAGGFDAAPQTEEPRFAFPPRAASDFGSGDGSAHAPPPVPAWTRHNADPRMDAYDDGAPPIPAFLRGAQPNPPPHASASGGYDGVLYGEELPLARQAEPNPYAPDAGYGAADGNPYGTAADPARDYDPNDPYTQPYDSYDPNGQGAYDDGAYPEDRQPLRRKNGGLVTIIAIVVLAIVGTAGAYAYRSFFGTTHSGPPPVIKADNAPNKIVPPRKDSEQNGKLIYDRIGNNPAGSKIVSREEQPVAIAAGTAQSPRVVFPPLNPPNQQPAAQQGQQRADSIAAVIAADNAGARTASPFDEPKKIRTLTIRPDQPVGAPSADSGNDRAPAASEPPTPVRARVATAPSDPQETGPINLAPQGQSAAVAAQSATASGGYLVQVSSQRSDVDARASFRALQSKFSSVLGSRDVVVRRVDLGSRGVYYRAMVGPFASSGEASQLCSDLKAVGGQCVIQRN